MGTGLYFCWESSSAQPSQCFMLVSKVGNLETCGSSKMYPKSTRAEGPRFHILGESFSTQRPVREIRFHVTVPHQWVDLPLLTCSRAFRILAFVGRPQLPAQVAHAGACPPSLPGGQSPQACCDYPHPGGGGRAQPQLQAQCFQFHSCLRGRAPLGFMLF